MPGPPHLGALRNSTLLFPSPITLCQPHLCPSAHCTRSRSPSPARRLAQAAAIVGVLPELKLELYSLKRQEKAFAGLVATVKDTLFKHDDEQVGRGGGRGGGAASRCESWGGRGCVRRRWQAGGRAHDGWCQGCWNELAVRVGECTCPETPVAAHACVFVHSAVQLAGTLKTLLKALLPFSRCRQRWSACVRWRCVPRRAPTPSRLV